MSVRSQRQLTPTQMKEPQPPSTPSAAFQSLADPIAQTIATPTGRVA